MASLGQYQSFALIAYDALRIQNDKMCCLRDNGENVSDEARLLFIARYMIDIVLYYSAGELSYSAATENDIISICSWLTNNLSFFTEPISQLDSTILNGENDFNNDDFNAQDFA
jgi:hypothetical protein